MLEVPSAFSGVLEWLSENARTDETLIAVLPGGLATPRTSPLCSSIISLEQQ